jgi:hypothetical protein
MNRKVVRVFKNRIVSAKAAIHYCVMECPLRGSLGCALTCELRQRFGIPPFGSKWPDGESFKLTQPIKPNVKLRLWENARNEWRIR